MTIEPFEVTAREAGGAVVLELRGELDVATVPLLREALAATAGTTVVVDLQELTFMDSSGISAFIHARKQLARDGHRLLLTRPSPNVRRVLDIVGLTDWLEEWSPVWSR
jgi:anti-sigma B factor antagonist